jgi:hypothetical protein
MEQRIQCHNWDLTTAQNISAELEKFVPDRSYVFKNQVIGSWSYSFDYDDEFGMSDSEFLISNSYGRITWISESKVEIGDLYSIVDGQVDLDINYVFEIFDKWIEFSDKQWDEITSPAYYPISSLPFDQGLLFYVIAEFYKNIDRTDPNYTQDVDIDIALQIGRVLKFCLYGDEKEPHKTITMRMMTILGKNPDPDNLTIEMMNKLQSLTNDVELRMNDKFYSKFIVDGLISFSEYSGYPLNQLFTYNALLLGENSPIANENEN